VPGEHIVTAAHVVRQHWRSKVDGLEDPPIAWVVAGGRKMPVAVRAVDLMADIAVLGEVDGQRSEAFFEAWMAFKEFCESTGAVPLCTADFPVREPCPVHILTHDKGWVAGQAQQSHVNASALYILADDHIESGTSGGPVVTDDGLLLGVVSHAGGTGGPMNEVGIPRLHLAVPSYLLRTFSLLIVEASWSVVGTKLIQKYETLDCLPDLLPHRADRLRNVKGVGLLRWTDVIGVFSHCAEAASRVDERAFAVRALDWFRGKPIR
jgi:hypothetical protein